MRTFRVVAALLSCCAKASTSDLQSRALGGKLAANAVTNGTHEELELRHVARKKLRAGRVDAGSEVGKYFSHAQQVSDAALVSTHRQPGAQEGHKPKVAHGPHLAETLGMSVPTYAFWMAIISGLSLPVGALMGVRFSPVKDHYIAAMMAFGAGALLFAVTVELYGHALHEVRLGKMTLFEINATMVAAVVGGLFYLWMDRWLHQSLMHGDVADEVMRKDSAREGWKDALVDVEKELAREAETRQGRGVIGKLQDLERVDHMAQRAAARRSWKKIRDSLHKVSAVARMHHGMSVGIVQKERQGGRSPTAVSRLFRYYMEEAMNQVKYENKDQDEQERLMLEREREKETAKAKLVALGLFVGLLIDGIPEGILMGFLAAEGHLSPVFIISLFVANFPEAFSSASLLRYADVSITGIVAMWSGLCLLVAALCGFSCWTLLALFPNYTEGDQTLPGHWLFLISCVEGITGGAMIACISAVMLPEAFERSGSGSGNIVMSSGFMCLLGFLLSVSLKINESP